MSQITWAKPSHFVDKEAVTHAFVSNPEPLVLSGSIDLMEIARIILNTNNNKH